MAGIAKMFVHWLSHVYKECTAIWSLLITNKCPWEKFKTKLNKKGKSFCNLLKPVI